MPEEDLFVRLLNSEAIQVKLSRQCPVELGASVSSSTSVFMVGSLEYERDALLEVEDGLLVHGEVAAV